MRPQQKPTLDWRGKMHLFKTSLLLALILTIGDPTYGVQSSPQDSTQDSPEGWLWYKDPALEDSEPVIEDKAKESPQAQEAPKTSVEELEAYKQRFEEAKAKAILNPTLENIAHAQKLHNAIIDQATDFQKMWNVAEMLDVSQHQIPVSPSAAKIDRRLQKESLNDDLKALSQDYGLIFAFKADCPYCHRFAPLVTEFAHRHGFDLQGLSKDNSCFKDMSCSKNPIAMDALNAEGVYPILYLANANTKDVIPVARGMINIDQLRANMKHALNYIKTNAGGLQ